MTPHRSPQLERFSSSYGIAWSWSWSTAGRRGGKHLRGSISEQSMISFSSSFVFVLYFLTFLTIALRGLYISIFLFSFPAFSFYFLISPMDWPCRTRPFLHHFLCGSVSTLARPYPRSVHVSSPRFVSSALIPPLVKLAWLVA